MQLKRHNKGGDNAGSDVDRDDDGKSNGNGNDDDDDDVRFCWRRDVKLTFGENQIKSIFPHSGSGVSSRLQFKSNLANTHL